MTRSPSARSASVTSVALVKDVSPGASFLYVVLSPSETVTIEPASVLIVNCFAAASIALTSPIAYLAVMLGSALWAKEEGIEAKMVISPIAAAKNSVLITLPFLLLREHRKMRIYDW